MNTYNEFLISTASNLIATIAGVLIGVPIALHVNARSVDRDRLLKKSHQIAQAVAALGLLESAVLYHMKILDRSIEGIKEAKIYHNLDLRSQVIDIALPKLVDADLAPELLQIISHHWMRLSFLDKLNSKMFQKEFGDEDWRNEDQCISMWKEFIELTASLRAHCDEILGMIKASSSLLVAGRAAVRGM